MGSVGRRRETNLELPRRVYLKHGAYYYFHKNGKWERLAKVGEELQMRQKWAVLEDPECVSGSMSALIDEYLVKYALPNKARRTYEGNCIEAEHLKLFFGSMQPHNIAPRHIGQYLDLNREQRPVRANREKALLSHVYTWAMRHQIWGVLITSNPCRGVKRNPETKRIRILDDSEYKSVFDKAHPNVKRLMTLVYRTLQRPSDLLNIGARNIVTRLIDGTQKRVLSIKQSKTGAIVEIIISQEIEEAIAADSNIIYPTFIHTAKGKPYSYSGIDSLFRRALEKHRIQEELSTGVKPPPFGIYDIKGKGATDMYRSGVPMEQIQMLAGHESITTTEIYIKSHQMDPVMPNQRKMSV